MDILTINNWLLLVFLFGAFVGYAGCVAFQAYECGKVDEPLPIYTLKIIYVDHSTIDHSSGISSYFFQDNLIEYGGGITHLDIRSYVRRWLTATYRINTYAPEYDRCIDQITAAAQTRVGGHFQCGDLCIFEVIPVGQWVTTIMDGQPIVK